MIFFLFISLAVVFGAAAPAIKEMKISKELLSSKESYFFSEGALEDVSFRVFSGKNMPSELGYNDGLFQATATVSEIIGAGENKKEITVSGAKTGLFRKLKTILTAGSGVSFHYGVQVGAGGLEMEENSEVRGAGGGAGSVYSNGSVEGENGAKITGDLIVAGNNSIDDIIVLGTARVNSINDSKICGDAYYQVIDSSSLSFLNNPSGSTCPDPETPGTAFPGSPDPPAENMPVSGAAIQNWKDAATAGGTITGNCGDSGVASCVINNNGALSLGPKKIAGNLVLTKKQTLILTGTLYFTGSISFDSSSGATMKCDPSFGTKSCVIISDSWIHISNNAVFQGSGVAGSYIMIVSTLAGCNGSPAFGCTHHDSALDLHNNATGAIFYIPESMAYLHNGVSITELTANKIHLNNNAIVTYEQGLADADFSAGPTGGWKMENWREIP